MSIQIKFKFDNWKLKDDSKHGEQQQYDNLTVKMRFEGEFPTEFSSWKALLRHNEYLDVISLDSVDSGYECVLNEDQLAFNGMYEVQLRAEDGERTKHSDKSILYVPSSLSGDAQWPTLPTVFTQAVERAESAQEASEEAQGKAEDAQQAAEDARDDLLNSEATDEEVEEIITEYGGNINGN